MTNPGMSRGDYYPSLDGYDDRRRDDDGGGGGGGSSCRMDDDDDDDDDDVVGGTGTDTYGSASHIVTIRSSNIAGMIGGGHDVGDDGGTMDGTTSSSEIRIDFGNGACFVAVTGER
jgi:hypothetical protein